ncbi:HTH ArsR-type DNA-binding domain [Moorella glycerini]|uniref:Transcriptional repressor SdpR n=1 Tax=Neomoorella stamsii TaxID=1266720 RepID=A0A9X7J4M6_9FIRM|nr:MULTISPECIES: autorepressor SdpR family transcription factor [Moorella]PRR74612.1 Transcriptional repressor SdpR [Moorella stamsii]CEP69101.1 HTH ArsR-type DNA-binding domain [Moorella glycerini]
MGLNALFKALGDETRREILRRLARGDMSAGEIAAAFDLSWPTISHHLSVLKEAGLVQDEKKGQYVIYSLNTTVFQDIAGWLFDLLGTITERQPAKKGEVRKENGK